MKINKILAEYKNQINQVIGSFGCGRRTRPLMHADPTLHTPTPYSRLIEETPDSNLKSLGQLPDPYVVTDLVVNGLNFGFRV
jgi:hypothetical protein